MQNFLIFQTVVKKAARPSPTTPTKTLSSPRTPILSSPAKAPSTARSSTITMNAKVGIILFIPNNRSFATSIVY